MPSLLTIARELKEQRARLVNQNRELLERAESERRDMTAEERQQYDTRWNQIEELGQRAERLERQAEVEAGLEARGNPARPEPEHRNERNQRTYTPESRIQGGVRRSYVLNISEDAEARQMSAFSRYIQSGRSVLSDEERRSLQMDDDSKGGFLVAPQRFVADLIQAVDDAVFIRQFATVTQLTGAESIGRPSLDADPDDAEWTSELATGSDDTAMKFGKRELRPHPLAKRVKISRKLMRTAALGVVGIATQRLSYKFGVTQEKVFLTGDGAQKPLGLFVASDDGIPTSRDISTDNTATSITADGLKNAKWALKGQYHPRARWIFHRDALKQIDKLKDGEGRYIWQPGLVAGAPDTLLNIPVSMSEYAPNTFTTGQYVGLLGDLSYYWIVESLAFELQRLDELYAETNQIGLIGRMEIDAMPVLAEAFVRVKLA